MGVDALQTRLDFVLGELTSGWTRSRHQLVGKILPSNRFGVVRIGKMLDGEILQPFTSLNDGEQFGGPSPYLATEKLSRFRPSRVISVACQASPSCVSIRRTPDMPL
ncbi:hypothetical protein EV128_101575 [Rhizobium azibense]|nr:hypothetical protein EV128_101575 [Rhizobium azibense]